MTPLVRTRQRALWLLLPALTLWICTPDSSHSQSRKGTSADPDTTETPLLLDELEEITVQSTRWSLPLRRQPIQIETIRLDGWNRLTSTHMADLLEERSGLVVRSHGPGSMALSSQRGLSSGQSQVFWEGFPIRSLSLNQTDLSLLSAPLFRSVEISPGTPSSAWGGGALGGSIHLRSRAEPVERGTWRAGLHAGSFGHQEATLSGVQPVGEHRFQLAGLLRQAENDFPYQDPLSGEDRRRRFNEGREGQLLAGWERDDWASRLWLWNRAEEIPGSLLSSSATAEQVDRGFRWTGSTRVRLRGWSLQPSAYLEQYTFHYDQESPLVRSRIRSRRFLTRLDIARPSTGAVQWRGGLEAGHESIRTNNYNRSPVRRTLAVRLHPLWRTVGGRVLWTPALRLDHYSDQGWVWSPSLGLNVELIPNRLHLRGMASHNFNPPSFNDLYWTPGGNPDLEPERGVTLEGGIHWEPDLEGWDQMSLTLYRIRLRNGIYWTPRGGSVWSPENVERLHAHGVEVRSEGTVDLTDVSILWGAAADLRHSQIGRPRFEGDQAVGRQMRYIPLWSVRSRMGVRWNRWESRLRWRWTDRRYTTADHSSWLNPFHLLDLTLSREMSLAQRPWQLSMEVKNLLDSRYEWTPWYPMPGRHLMVSLRLGLAGI